MEHLKVAKVDSVLLQKANECRQGTLHLTQHHLIFIYDKDGVTSGDNRQATSSSLASTSNIDTSGEVWLPYSLLWAVTRLPSIQSSDSAARSAIAPTKRIYPLIIRLRNFESAALGFSTEALLTDVFESIKGCIVAPMPENLYAFFHVPRPALALSPQGWHIYDPKAEFARQGVGSRTKAWRFCDLNAGYGFCSTYPSQLCVPSRITDTTIRHASKYRSKERIPALTYLHWANLASITRSSQPLVGLNNRSMQDEKLIEAIFTSHLFADPESATAQAALVAGSNNTSTGNAATDRGNVIAIYGATTTNLIVDARPTTNAMANRAKGAGTENMEHYKGCKKVYLGVDNIHVMRDSLQKVTDALRASEPSLTFEVDHINTATEGLRHDNNGPRAASSDEAEALPLDHIMLKRSYWLRHISALLEGTAITTKNIHVNNSHVLIHCSDGWDRTSQLASLAEICLDPYYRTMKGFAVLVEKDWCSFGHRFWDRCGHASSEKYFSTAQGYGEDNSDDQNVGDATTPSGGFEPQAAANAFWGFTKQITANFQSSSDSHTSHGRGGAHLKETSPVFHQFLDCIWQIMRQYPSRFEFNEAWLLDLYDGLYECKYGTFLYNSEGERNGLSEVGMKPAASSRSTSIWDFMLDEGRRELYSNQLYDRNLDTDSKRSGADMGVLLPNSKDVGFWGRLFRKDGKEMNRLVEAEAEERKRQIEGVERQRQYDDSAVEATASSLGPAEVEGVTVGPVVQGGQDDPVLRNGVVEVSKTDRDGLTYRPYEPRSRPSQARPLHHLEGKSSSQIPIRLNRDVPVEESPLGAQEAAAKMKTMFLGWGAKFQDAYTIATSGPERPTPSSDDTSSFSSAPTRENSAIAKSGVTGQHAGLNNVASQGGRRSAAPSTYTPRSPPIRESNANPWAASAATRRNYNNLEGLPNELVPAVQGANLGHPDKAQQTKSKGEAGEGREGKVGADYDPLGVGNI